MLSPHREPRIKTKVSVNFAAPKLTSKPALPDPAGGAAARKILAYGAAKF
ncbi:hypothetical protein GCM10027058_31710 [Microbacterium neimengense]